jgi:hypothetical protein
MEKNCWAREHEKKTVTEVDKNKLTYRMPQKAVHNKENMVLFKGNRVYENVI